MPFCTRAKARSYRSYRPFSFLSDSASLTGRSPGGGIGPELVALGHIKFFRQLRFVQRALVVSLAGNRLQEVIRQLHGHREARALVGRRKDQLRQGEDILQDPRDIERSLDNHSRQRLSRAGKAERAPCRTDDAFVTVEQIIAADQAILRLLQALSLDEAQVVRGRLADIDHAYREIAGEDALALEFLHSQVQAVQFRGKGAPVAVNDDATGLKMELRKMLRSCAAVRRSFCLERWLRKKIRRPRS